MNNPYYPHLASPITIGGVTFKNRIWGSPLSSPELDPDCHMRKEDIAFHENRVSGGMASTTIGLGIVDPIGRTHTKEIILYDRMSLPSLKEYSKAIHRHGAIACMELAHGGKYANARSHGSHEQGLILGPMTEINAEGFQVTGMNDEQIEHAANCFAEAAALCKEAGIDMVLVHGGHGWLIGQFMSPTMNHRGDKWGGSRENRMRFPLLVIQKIRERCGPGLLIEFRMSGSELIEGGYTIEEGVEMAKYLDGKVDIIHVSAGVHEDDFAFTITHPSMFQPHGVNVKYAAEIKKAVNTPVATLGGLSDPEQMEEIIASGQADIIEIARQSLADPYLPEKAFSGRADEIVKCCRCYTCFYNYLTNRTFCCALNPTIGNELEAKFTAQSSDWKYVAVIGGGPAGMMAALTAARRGHEVDLYEKNDELGGWLVAEKYIPFKEDMYNFVKAMEVQLENEGVNILLNTKAKPKKIRKKGYDAVLIGVGSKPIVPPIPGIDLPIVQGLEALHDEDPDVGEKVVILGGGLVGSEVGIYLDMLGKDVTVVEMKADWAEDAYFMHKNAMRLYLQQEAKNIRFLVNTTAKEVTEYGLVVINPDGSEELLRADTVLLAAGLKADLETAQSFMYTAPHTAIMGDAIHAGRVVDATSTGYYMALDI